ncbi:2,4-dienoyl-CoA reductase [Sporichthya brevicatena]|uniref:Peroxisomal trans-2-enoyl-CoA reductase n=1 Tax=Sporichthya brevicatena TaxID=171442 RepID=A0ABN1GQT4_9ACTN
MSGLPVPPPLGTAMLPAGTFAGQVVAVTGGGTGLGKAIAVEFARLGAAVAVLSRKPEHHAKGVAAIEVVGAKAGAFAVDVRDPEAIAVAFDEVEAALGPVDVLVNNAAGNFPQPAEDISPRGWRAVTDIVLDGTFFASTEFARRARAGGRPGAVLNIAATYAWTGGPGTAHSAAAKAGVVNLTQSLAVEWAPDGIRVNGLAPGLFPHEDVPPQMRADTPEGLASLARTVPAGRVGSPHELGWAATFLCSPYAAYLTGHTLVLDGGNWLRRGLRMPDFLPVREQFPPPPDAKDRS